MGALHSICTTIGNREDFSPAAWREFFEPSAIPMWERDEGGGIQFRNDNFAQGDTPIGPGFEFLEGDVPCPENSFLPLDVVWQVVSQFLTDPEKMPQAVTWVDSESDQLESMEDYM